MVYSSDFSLQGAAADESYVIELGQVEGVASVSVNGTEIGKAFAHPFLVDITDAARVGQNTIKVSVRPPLRNALVGRALAGDKFAEHMKTHENNLVRLGLVKPVRLFRVDGDGRRIGAAKP